MNEKISEVITKKLLSGLNEERITYNKIHFYIETMLSEIEKLVILLFLFGTIGKIKSIMMIYIIAILVRRYSGGNHCKSFIGCLFYSIITSLGIVVLEMILNSIDVEIMFVLILLHLVIMIMFAPIKSSFRPTLRKEDVIKIKVKGIIGIILSSSMYCILDMSNKKTIFLTLLF